MKLFCLFFLVRRRGKPSHWTFRLVQFTNQTEKHKLNSVATCWHQWSKKVRAHPAPLICSSLYDNTLPLSLPKSLSLKPMFSLFFLLSQSHVCVVPPPYPPVDAPTLSAQMWCPPSDQLQLGCAQESDIIITGEDRDRDRRPPIAAGTAKNSRKIRRKRKKRLNEYLKKKKKKD